MSFQESIQHQAWASGTAADAYFERNRSGLQTDSPPSRSTLLYASYIKPGERILEVGTANGRVLEQLRRLTGCQAYGTDPSPAAIADGLASYRDLHLAIGTADKIEYPDRFFDVVLFGFCLYLVDRSILMRVVAEADRVLAEGGRLMITDFDPVSPHRRPFKHQEGLWSYKMYYPGLWLCNPDYVLAEKISFSHGGEAFHIDANERVAAWVLVKQGPCSYPERP